MRHVKPTAVLTGALVSLALVVLAWVILFDPPAPDAEQGSTWVWTFAALGAHILGGLVAGGMARRSPGLNGALSAVLCPVLLVAGYFAFVVIYNLILHGPAGIVPDYLNSPAEIREFVTDEEFFGAFVLALAMAVYTSVAVLVGFLAGSVVGRFRSSTSAVDG